jgi:hypothetical protein
MPIGCALTFFVHADKKIPTNGALRSKLDVVRRCDFVALASAQLIRRRRVCNVACL